jgi:hypothetical protein
LLGIWHTAVSVAAVWFAVAFFTRLFAKRDLIALLVLTALLAICFCGMFPLVMNT